MAASSTNVQYLLGDFYDEMGSSKAAIVTAQIERAQNFVDNAIGKSDSSLADNLVEELAASYCLIRAASAAGAGDSFNVSVTGLSVSASSSTNTEISSKLKILRDSIEEKKRILGYTEDKWVIKD